MVKPFCPGMKIQETKWLKHGADVVIPPYLFVAADFRRYYGNAIIQHGYGHFLQYKKHGFLRYYFNIAPRSILAALRKDDGAPVEVEANKLAHEFYGEASLMGGKTFPIV